LEEWSPMENRDRMLWSVVKDQQNAPIGTFIFELFHNHTQFEFRLCHGFLLLEKQAEKILSNRFEG
jgi:hypothetical protein